MNHSLGPSAAGIGELEDHAASTLARSAPTGNRGSVEIARRIERDTFVGLSTIRPTCKAVEHSVESGRSDLEDRAAAVGSALHGGAVEIAGAVAGEFCVQVLAIGAPGEAIDHFGGACSPSRCDEKNCGGADDQRRAG